MSRLIYPPVIDSDTNSQAGINRHGRYYHLHFDIRSHAEVSHRLLESFVVSSAGELTWTDFVRPSRAEVQEALPSFSDVSCDTLTRLCDPDRCGAPMSHLSARKQFLPAATLDVLPMWRLFDKGVAAMRSSSLTGYVEMEELSCRHVLTSPLQSSGYCEELPRLPFAEFDRVPLSHPSVNRQFRTTEVHCTFEQIGKADLRVLDALIGVGFYTAYLRHTDGSLKLILTIQGFEPDIGLIYGLLHGWLTRCQVAGLIHGTVTLKKEDIVGYAILGNPEESGMQMVVKPMSVVESLTSICGAGVSLECTLP